MACYILPDPVLFRAIFLTAFYRFLRMSNVAPHKSRNFDPDRHFFRHDVTFTEAGALCY